MFLERDGILNNADGAQPPNRVEDFHINQEAKEPLNLLKEAGFLLIATTNQPGVCQGSTPRRDIDLMHELLRRTLPLDDILTCPHEVTDDCPCRKPRPGLFQEAAFKWHAELDRSYVISDKWQDAEAAHQVGCISLLINSPKNGKGHHDFILNDLNDVVGRIVQLEQSRPALADSGVYAAN